MLFFMAIVLSYIYYKTKNIMYSFSMHALYNLVSQIVYYTGYKSILIYVILSVLVIIYFIYKCLKFD